MSACTPEPAVESLPVIVNMGFTPAKVIPFRETTKRSSNNDKRNFTLYNRKKAKTGRFSGVFRQNTMFMVCK
jgi:hypothetical protein